MTDWDFLVRRMSSKSEEQVHMDGAGGGLSQRERPVPLWHRSLHSLALMLLTLARVL